MGSVWGKVGRYGTCEGGRIDGGSPVSYFHHLFIGDVAHTYWGHPILGWSRCFNFLGKGTLFKGGNSYSGFTLNWNLFHVWQEHRYREGQIHLHLYSSFPGLSKGQRLVARYSNNYKKRGGINCLFLCVIITLATKKVLNGIFRTIISLFLLQTEF